MEYYHESGVIKFMLTQASRYTEKVIKMFSNGARTILKGLIF